MNRGAACCAHRPEPRSAPGRVGNLRYGLAAAGNRCIFLAKNSGFVHQRCEVNLGGFVGPIL